MKNAASDRGGGDTGRAMSQENVEIVRRGNEAWNAGDLDAALALYHPDVIARAPAGWPEPGPFVGRDAVMQQFARLREAWASDALREVTEPLAVGDRVVARMAWAGTGRGPGLNLELTFVWTVRKGLIFEIEFLWDHAEALEAVGLRE